MTPERWQRIEELYHSALERDPGQRSAFLGGACQGDEDLRREVESLLAQTSSLLNRPAWPAASGSIEDPTLTALAVGSQLGPYKIESALGSGGMGKVYRARDTRLNRSVAIKVLSRQFTDRFEREARSIAALNHPHICTLHDVGPNYLVMELVEGETLADRLKKGPLAMAQTLQCGAQIADALAAAHAKGIVHRDLKPGNIMLTRSGVKVLDFGLAKSPQDETVTQGVMGTPAYMAPEQREGRECDARTDIYALGLVLYEMATGKRALQDASPQLHGLPALFAHVVEVCLAGDPEDRWQSTRDITQELNWIGTEKPAEDERRGGTDRRRMLVFAAIAGVLLLMALVMVVHFLQRRTPNAIPIVRLAIPLPGEYNLGDSSGGLGPPAISPDGKMVAVAAGSGSKPYLWLRRLDSDKFERLAGTEGALQPFSSPDSRQIGFFADGKLKKLFATGGNPQTLCAVLAGAERDGTWSTSGTILYGINYEGLYRVDDRGGQPALVAGLDQSLGENSLRNPAFLADAKRFIYFSRTRDQEKRGVYLDGVATTRKKPRKKLLISDGDIALGRDPTTGDEYLFFTRDGKLWAQRLNSVREELEGDPAAIAEDVGFFSVSETGTLVFQLKDSTAVRLTWFDRAGKELGTLGQPVPSVYGLELSPNDRYAAYINHRSIDGHFSIWIVDTTRDVVSPFSAQNVRSFDPVWSPDSRRLYFYSDRGGSDQIFGRGIDETGPEQMINKSSDRYRLLNQSADGKYFLAALWSNVPGTKRTLAYTSSGLNDWRTLIGTGATEDRGQFSPDGRWVAYQSDESGSWEVYVTDFPGGRHKQRVSVAGGREPRWRRDGKELLYYAPEGALMSLSLSNGMDTASAKPEPLFKIRFTVSIEGFHYALSRDGQRILALKEVGQERSRDLNIVFNWPQLLRPEPGK